jgi:hypothetical protein
MRHPFHVLIASFGLILATSAAAGSLVPVANDDANSASEGGSAVTGNVVTNDDPGDAPATVTAADQAGNPITVGTPFPTAAGGSLTLQADGDYSYVPPAQGSVPFGGVVETFDYTITDSTSDTASATLTITVANNEVPVANPDTAAQTQAGGPSRSGNVLANDLPGDAPTSVTAASQGGNGFAIGAPFPTAIGGTLTLNADGSFTYAPPAAFNRLSANEAFDYTVTDSDGDTASATLTINVLGNPPLACDATNQTCINELLIEMPGKDTTREYIELRGPPGGVIAEGTYLLSIDGDRQQNPGRIDTAIRLGGLTFGTSDGNSPYGFLVILPFGNQYGPQISPSATVLQSTANGFSGLPDGRWTGAGTTNYDRPTTSYLLVQTLDAPPVGLDIDTNNDGVPETNPETAWAVIDSVGGADHPQDRSYARINFRKGGTSAVGTTVGINFRPGYFARFGDSFGSTPAAWVASTAVSGSYPNWVLPGQVVPSGLVGKPLNHIGRLNAWPNAAPIHNLPATQTTNEDTPLVFSTANANLISITDTDAGTGMLTVTITIATGTFSLNGTGGLTFTTGDGTADATMTFSGALANVNARLAGARYTPPLEYFGPDSVTFATNDNAFTGTDGPKSDLDTLNINVLSVNDLPNAVDDAFATPEETPLTGTVATNDTMLGDTPVAFTLETPAMSGVATVDSAGGFTYSPDINFSGFDSFTYRVTDDDGESDVATVTITVTPVSDTTPDAVDDNAGIIEDGGSISGSVADNDAPGVDAPFTWALATPPSNGTATVAANGDYTYTPNLNFNGVDTFTYRLTDVDGGSDFATVTITVTPPVDDGPPDAVDDAFATNEDVALSGTVGANDLNLVDTPITFALGQNVANGTLAFNTDGSFTYTPNANFSGTDTFTYTVTDFDGQGDTATVTITVANVDDDVPTANPQSVTTPFETPIAITVTGSDPEGATLVYALGTGPTNGTLSGTLPNVTYTPNMDYDGPDSFTFTVFDGTNTSAPATVSITVLSEAASNTPPTALDDSYVAVTDMPLVVGAPGVLANDTDPDVPTVLSAVPGTGPASGTLTLRADGSFDYVPAPGFVGTVTFTYSASDGISSSAPATVTIDVRLDAMFRDGFENPPPPMAALARTVELDAGSGSATVDLGAYRDAVTPEAWAAVVLVAPRGELVGAFEVRRVTRLEVRVGVLDGDAWRYGDWTAVADDALVALRWISIDGARVTSLRVDDTGAAVESQK